MVCVCATPTADAPAFRNAEPVSAGHGAPEERGDALTRAYAAILDEARATVAAGRVPDSNALGAQIRAAGGDGAAEGRALRQLEAIVAVHRARARVASRPSPPPAAAPRARRLLRSRPTVSGNMDVRRRGDSTLEWDPAPGVTGWEVRISERPDPRREYVVRETLTLGEFWGDVLAR